MSAVHAPKRRRRTAGDQWRVQGEKEADTSRLGPFDEIVVGRKGEQAWLHVEMLDHDSAYVSVGDQCLWVHIPRGKAPRITMTEKRPWRPWKQCRKRPGGRRCGFRAGHVSECMSL